MQVKPEKDQKKPSLDFRDLSPDQVGMLLNAILEARRILGDQGVVLNMRSKPMEGR
jgi:hypothetical protein